MIYKSLRTLPMITYADIIDTGDIGLLTDDDKPSDSLLKELWIIWADLYEQYKEKYDNKLYKKTFNANKEISYLSNKYDEITCIIDSLTFAINDDLINILLEYGYKVNLDNYMNDLDKIKRESKGIIIKINALKDTLPKESKEENSISDSIVNLMAGYSSILGYDFDFYTISVEKFHSIEKQVKQKIAAVEKQNANKK